MVLRDGSVKVADFGIACLENSAQTLTQEALGSVHYISPEQARGDRTDARSDIYSAGVVLYEMLTNRLPFEGDSAVSVAIQHLSSIPLAPREINSEIPGPLELICMGRRQTVREVLEIGVVAESILALSATCSAVSVNREGSLATLRTGVTIRALYLDEGGVPLVAERSIDVSCPMTEAAEIGTRKVIAEHSTIGIVITTDGTIAEIPRENYLEAEERVIRELQELGKPFLVLLNSADPKSDRAIAVSRDIASRYGVICLPVNCLELTEESVGDILKAVLYEFPMVAHKITDVLGCDHRAF